MKSRYLLFTLMLIAVEVYQYVRISDTHFLTGDFSIALKKPEVLPWAFLLSLTTWIGAYLLERSTRSAGKVRLVIPDSNWILLIFVANLAITVFANVGVVAGAASGSLAILTTLVPTTYLILVMGSQKLGPRFYLAGALLVLTDLYRLLLSAVFKLFYIYVIRARHFVAISLILFPIAYLGASYLIAYKYEQRKMELPRSGNLVLESTTRRIGSTTTFAYGLEKSEELAYFCHDEPYASQYTAALLSVIPKRMFGFEFVKTYNNCLIEYRVGAPVSDSSVNSPWLLNIVLLAKFSLTRLLGYLLLTLSMLGLVIAVSNYLFGSQASLFKYWVCFEFLWTGNILTLTIPVYFLILLLIIEILQKPATLNLQDQT